MHYIIKFLSGSLLAISVGACCNITSESKADQLEPEKKRSITAHGTRGSNAQVVQDLRKIVESDPIVDAKQALSEGNKSLWVVSNRAKRVLPGLENISEIEQKLLTLQAAPGMGDTIYGNEHIQLRRQFLEYAAKYNQTIWNAR